MSEQERIVMSFREILRSVEMGRYGIGDDIDTDCILDDVEEALSKPHP